MKILLLAFTFVTSAAAAATGGSPVNHKHPAVTFVGKHDGDILKCNQEKPNDCSVFHSVVSRVYSLLISGEYLYAGLDSGVILRCDLNTESSCKTFYSSGADVWSLASATGYLFAGLVDGTILRCDLEQKRCQTFHNAPYSVDTLFEKDAFYLFAGLASGEILGSLANVSNNFRDLYLADAGISGIASLKGVTYVLTNEGQLLKCPRIESPSTGCETVDAKIKNGTFWDIKAFNESLYVYGNDNIGICKWVKEGSCETHISVSSAWRFAMAYGTHTLQDEYKTEHTTCKQGEVCQLVPYFNALERYAFEVYADSRYLKFSSNHSLVDTTDADQGHSGPAALFVMAPDGKIYLSKHHKNSVHTSSFLAGNPVSGAGEIVVENGVIKKIVACSNHYEPDLELNKQVIQSLRTQGYTEPIVSEACH